MLPSFPGGRFGNLFDDDPKQWRMYADFIGSAGRFHFFSTLFDNRILDFTIKIVKSLIGSLLCSVFDLATPLYPSYFLPLASLGNLTKVFYTAS